MPVRGGGVSSNAVRAATSGRLIVIGGRPECELVAGGTVIATGEIVEREGSFFFEAKESNR